MAEFQITQSGLQTTIMLGDHLVASIVPDLKKEMKRLIGEGITALTLDCSHLEVMDSTGIGCLIAAHNSLTKVNGSLVVVQVSTDIYDLLCSMRLDRHFKITPQVAIQE
jgi:anti-anti-sigma factor